MAKRDQSPMLDDIVRETRVTALYTGINQLSQPVLNALKQVQRADFVPEKLRPYALDNRPLPIDSGQTISQPFMVAIMTELLRPTNEAVVLEIGTGSGYQAAVLSCLVKRLYSLEVRADLARGAAERLARLGYDNVTCRQGDGHLGWQAHAPYDGIVVTAAAEAIPDPLLRQLKPGGRLVIPVGSPYGLQSLFLIERQGEHQFERHELFGVAFVPLIKA